jgi:hypothetical protein
MRTTKELIWLQVWNWSVTTIEFPSPPLDTGLSVLYTCSILMKSLGIQQKASQFPRGDVDT